MKRALLKQISYEWRNNIWLVLELAIVALAIWAILTLLWVQCKGFFQPLGFNPENVYALEVKSIPKTSPYFLNEYADNYFEDRNELISRLKKNPNVAFVSLQNNFEPFEYNYMGNAFYIEGEPDSVIYFGNFRFGEPEIIKVMEVESLTGKSQEQLLDMLAENKILLSPNVPFENLGRDVTELIGKKVITMGSDQEWIVGDVVNKVRRALYEADPRGVVILPLNPVNEWGNILVKLKPGKEKEFIEDFNTDPSLSHLRNVYLTNLTSLVKKGESIDREVEINIRLMVAISFFLLITIFLGLLGSFWFRVQQRVSEIAIRKTFGATNIDLFKRIIGEGLLLFLFGLIIISACVWPFIHDIEDTFFIDWYTILAIEGIMTGVMAIGIILSLWYPAWRAMKIEPAIAVKED